jgi:hypothetical protein
MPAFRCARWFVLIMTIILGVGCARDRQPQPDRGSQSLEQRITAEPAATPGTPVALLRIRRLDRTCASEPPAAGASSHAAAGGRAPEVPPEAKLLSSTEVLVPIGPRFTATTLIGRTTLKLVGTVERVAGDKLRWQIDYREETPFDPKLSWGTRSVSTVQELKTGEESVIMGTTGTKGERLVALCVLPRS